MCLKIYVAIKMSLAVVNYENDKEVITVSRSDGVTLYGIIRLIYMSIPPKCYFFHMLNSTAYRLVNNSRIISDTVYYLNARSNLGNVLARKGGCLNSLNLPRDVVIRVMCFLKPMYF